MTAVTTQTMSREVLEHAWDDHKALVIKIARAHARKYRQSEEDVISQATVYFLEAYKTFDPEFGTDVRDRIGFLVKKKLIRDVRVATKRSQKLRPCEADLEAIPKDVPEVFDRGDFVSGLSDDAKAVVGLVLDTPADLLSVFQSDPAPSPARQKQQTRGYLKRVMGWGAEKVSAAFGELKEAVS